MPRWNSGSAQQLSWSSPISNRQAKEEVAKRLASEVKDGDVIGVGSGSTSFLAIQAIGARIKDEHLSCTAIPTSAEVELACVVLGIPTTTLLAVRPDWAFDGTDEVDPDHNLIKGRGGAMFREKLVILNSPRTFILVDSSKLVKSLGERFPVPVETYPSSIHYVEGVLARLGARDVTLRLAKNKDGPVITETGNLILDARFENIAPELEREIKSVCGVIESGLFWGYDVQVLTAGQE